MAERPREPFFGPNWFLIPAYFALIMLFMFWRGEPEKRPPGVIYDRDGITITKQGQ